MAGFLYYITTGRPAVSEKDLIDAGAAYALDGGNGRKGRSFAFGPLGTGPDGASGGCIVAIDGDGTHAHFKPDDQEWVRAPGGKLWVGVHREAMPREQDLRRRRFIGGEKVELGNGELWTVPIARSVARGATLPRSFALGPDGETWMMKELPEFLSLCGDAEKVWEQLRPKDGAISFDIDILEQIRIAITALQVNYRIGPAEATLLGLLTTENRWEVVLSLVDWPEIRRRSADVAKKKIASVVGG